jgi:aconitate hydratase 2/2-methylisocitrate dehydratase
MLKNVEEYMEIVTQKIDPFAGELYRYLNFDQIEGFADEGRVVAVEDMPKIEDILGIPAGALK